MSTVAPTHNPPSHTHSDGISPGTHPSEGLSSSHRLQATDSSDQTAVNPLHSSDNDGTKDVDGAQTTSAPPESGDLPPSDSNEIMSEGHSDWEKVEKPVASPPKARSAGVSGGVKGKDGKEDKEGGLKGKVGEVRRVLKSGMFGGGSSKPTTKPAVPSRTAAPVRASLAPAKRGTVAAPTATVASGSATPTEFGSAPAAKPPVTGSMSGVRARVSTLYKPTASVANKADGGQTSKPAPPATTRTASTAAFKPTFGPAARSAKASLTASTTSAKPASPPATMSPTGSTGVATATTSGTAAPARTRASLAPAKTTVAPRTGVTAGRVSMAASQSGKAGAGRQVSAGSTASGGLTKLKDEKEAAEKRVIDLQLKVDELDKLLSEVRQISAEHLERDQSSIADIEAKHSSAVAALKEDHEKAESGARSEHDKQLDGVRASHAAELETLREQVAGLSKELENRADELKRMKEVLTAELTRAHDELDQTNSKIAEIHEHYHAELNEIKAALKASEATAADRQTEIAEVQSRLAALQKEKEKLEAEAQEGAEEAEKSMTDLGDVRGKVEELQNEVDRLEEELSAQKTKDDAANIALTAANQAALHDLKQEQGRVADLEGELGKAASEIKERRERIGQLITEEQKLSREIQDLKSSLADTESHLDRLNTTAKEDKAENERLSQILLDREGVVEELEANVKTAEDALKTSEAALGEAREQAMAQSARVDGLAAEKVFASEELVRLQTRIAELEGDVKNGQREADERYAKAHEDAKAKADEHHRNALEAHRSQNADVVAQLSAAHEAELTAMSGTHADELSSTAKKHSIELGEVRQRLTELETEVVSAGQAEKELQTKLESMQAKLAEAEQDVRAAKAAVSGKEKEAQGKMEVALKDLEGMRDELEGTKEVLEMNKSHFQLSLEELQEQHVQELKELAAQRAADSVEAETKQRDVSERAREELEALKKDLIDEKAEKNMALAKAEAGLSPEEVDRREEKLKAEHLSEVTRLNDLIAELRSKASIEHAAAAIQDESETSTVATLSTPSTPKTPKTPKKAATTAKSPSSSETDPTPAPTLAQGVTVSPSKVPIPPTPANKQDGKIDDDGEDLAEATAGGQGSKNEA